MIFSSNPPAEPRREYLECAHGDFPQDDGLDYCLCPAVWIEHPHAQHNEPNPILEALRQGEREDGSPLTEVAGDYLAALDIYAHHGDKSGRVKSGEWSDADPFDVVTCWPLQMLDADLIDHARRVLTRLANFAKLEG